MHARFIAPWKDSTEKPAIYHCLSRVVDRRFAFADEEREKLRMFMRMYENFSGCRVLAYCFMSNHIHLLLEVPPLPAGGFTDEGLLKRLRFLYSEAFVAEVAKRLGECRKSGNEVAARELHAGFTYRMHSLSEFMKGFMQRFTQWFNRKHGRSGGLWEDAFKSVLVEDGVASRTMAAYIDLNPVRAGMVTDPADYRWSSYGEAMGGGARGNGRKARAGLVRALMAHKGYAADARHWAGNVSKEYRMILLAEGEEKLREAVNENGKVEVKVARKGMKKEAVEAELARLERSRDVAIGKMLRCRVRYFSDGAVLGSREFVDGVFRACRKRFGPQRKSGARKLRGNAAAAAGSLWSVRDLKKGIGKNQGFV
ncbi:MAG: transposase [Verrucomicrobia bacterium]|nr:transposase [Verrucomicrobiota bacterium]